MYNRRFEIDEEHTVTFLDNTVKSVESDYDVDSLVKLAKLFKKNVPFSRRKYVIGYLLREALKHDHSSLRFSRFERGSLRKNEKREFTRSEMRGDSESSLKEQFGSGMAEERPHRPRVEIPEDQATTIFISIGRNRRVFPRDLITLLITVGGLERERIGNIKVLANYSFIQLYTEDSEKVIATLNNYDYRGRKLSVNLSRMKSDDENEEADSQTDDSEMTAEDAAAYAAAEKAASNEGFGS